MLFYLFSIVTAAVVAAIMAVGIKGIVLKILNAYKACVRVYLSLRGLTPNVVLFATWSREAVGDVCEARVVTGQAWDDFCDSLKAAGAVVMSKGTPKDAFNQAEGYRFLSRVLRGGLENFMECNDPFHPQLNAIANGLRAAPVKLGSDNPDNLYENATIDGRLSYLLFGNKNTVNLIGFGTQAGQYGKPGGLKTVDYKEMDDIHFEDDGSFEIFVGPQRPDGCKNYLRTIEDPPQGLLIVRQTFAIREKEIPAQLTIKLLNETSGRQFNCEVLEDALASTALLVGGASMMFARWADGFQQHKNQLPLFDQTLSNNVGGDPNIRYFHSYWELKPSEALIIEAYPPVCRTWNFQLNNYWMESLDYRYNKIHVNKFTATYYPDGKIRIVVAAIDPKLSEFDNYITTANHTCGTMCFRWVMPEVSDQDLPHPQTAVLNLRKR